MGSARALSLSRWIGSQSPVGLYAPRSPGRVIDCYSIKPIDTATLSAAAAATNGRIVIAEDHHPEGGLGSAVTDALLEARASKLRVAHLAVRQMPGSGSGKELMAWAGIDADHIAAAARALIGAEKPLTATVADTSRS